MTLRIPRPDDWHVHLRQGPESAAYARAHSAFGRILAMPNTVPPLVTPEEVFAYRKRAEAAAPGLTVVTAFRIMPGMGAGEIEALADAGVPVGKYYPEGATTNSNGGLTDWHTVEEALAAMEERDLVLSIHGEDPSAPVFEREEAFLPVFREIRRTFPRLRMILEHVSSAAGVETVAADAGPTAATVTVQHLMFTSEDLLGGLLNPHLFCKPVVKSASDRDAIRERLLEGDPRFFFGSDSAPHPRVKKESSSPPAGVYSAPMILSALATWFDESGALERLQPFLCDFGRNFYGVEPNSGETVLERRPWTVPGESEGCVPLMAGRELPWRVTETRVS